MPQAQVFYEFAAFTAPAWRVFISFVRRSGVLPRAVLFGPLIPVRSPHEVQQLHLVVQTGVAVCLGEDFELVVGVADAGDHLGFDDVLRVAHELLLVLHTVRLHIVLTVKLHSVDLEQSQQTIDK